MSVKTRDEIMESVKAILAEDTSDAALQLIEDLDDTITSYETKEDDGEDWESKYKELDASWRQRYRDRFFTKTVETEEDNADDEDEQEPPRQFSDLFKV